MLGQHVETKSRLIARIVREILKTESFDTMADLTEALKTRLALLRIRWTNDEISDAYALIDTNTPLLRPPPAVTPVRADADPLPIGASEATAILAAIRTRLGLTVSVKAMPRVRELTPVEIQRRQFHADRLKAYQLVEQEILETAQRCDRLEALRLVKSDTTDQEKETGS
jgi:hypothetical protein